MNELQSVEQPYKSPILPEERPTILQEALHQLEFLGGFNFHLHHGR
jgi:hypothetical protein